MQNFLLFIAGAVVLGIAVALKDQVEAWWFSRKNRIRRRAKVVVIADSRRRRHRRTVFWGLAFRSHEHDLRFRTRVRYLSIDHELRRRRNPANTLLSLAHVDMIVVNWDAINGDPVYGSDRALAFFTHYRPDIREWLNKGGLLVVEAQGASWSASAEPYGCLTALFPEDKSEVQLCSDLWTTGKHGAVNPAAADHPLAKGVESASLSLKQGGLWERKRWFPREPFWLRLWHRRRGVDSLEFIDRHPAQLYRGWFSEWTRDWTPVLVAKEEADGPVETSRAILLSRRAGAAGHPPGRSNGGVVLTTMFLASSEVFQLLANLVTFADSPGDRRMPQAPPTTSEGEVHAA